MKIDVTKIVPNPEQPRRDFDPGELNLLAESIRAHGLINPIAVEEIDGVYVLIDGERRWRASKLVGLTEIEAHVRPSMNDGGAQERLTLAVVANLQRSDLNPVEEGRAFARLRELGLSAVEIAKLVGVHISTVHNKIRILEFEPEIQQMFADRQITVSPNLLGSLSSLPAESRVRIIRGLVLRRATQRTIIAACKRISMGVKQSKRDAAVPSGEWSMLVMIEKPAPEVFAVAARETCQKCVLFEHANRSTCQDCPGVDLLKRLVNA